MTTLPQTLAGALYTAVRQVRHYGLGHPAAEEAIRNLHGVVREALSQASEVRWDASPEWLIVQGTLLPGDDRHGLPLRYHLVERGIARLVITPDVEASGLRVAIRLLALEPEELLAEGGVVDVLRATGTAGIEAAGPDESASLPVETDEYLAALTASAVLAAAVERGERIDVGRVQLVVEPLDPPAGETRALWTQVGLRGHDELDPPHPVNVAFLAMRLGGALALSRPERIGLGVAAFLHDIGMARLAWEDRLAERTRSARDPLPRHAVEAGRLLCHLGGQSSVPMLAAMEHHRVIVEGPRGVAGASEIVALADYVDAMTCGRVGALRPASLGGLMTTLLAGEGPSFNPLYVRALAAILTDASASGIDLVSPA